ncbi:MAG: hypothetical protein ACTSWL_06340, partial [Promethearchaeota archaeon]
RDGKIIKGLEVSGLKETEEMREARLALQEKYKDKCELQTLDIIRAAKTEQNFEIRVSRIKEQIHEDILNNLPLHFDDLLQELIDKKDIIGKIQSGVLYLKKEKDVLEE